MRARLALLAAAIAVAACGTDVKSGVMSVSLSGPSPAPRAAMFRVVGSHSGVTVPAGQPFRMFPSATGGDTLLVAVIADQGHTLTGALVSIQVADAGVPPTVTLLQVASADYQLLSTSSYTLTIAP